jgi:hypothetical protein
MDFFKTDEGVLHGNRIGGTMYLLILLSCGVAREPRLMCAMRGLFTLGWWLTFCGKHPSPTWSGTVATPGRMLGTTLVVVGIVGQFYAVWATAHAGIHN